MKNALTVLIAVLTLLTACGPEKQTITPPEPKGDILFNMTTLLTDVGHDWSGVSKFVVDTNGKVVSAQMVRSSDTTLDEAVLNALEKTEWTPAHNGRNRVPMTMTLPIKISTQ